MAGKRLYLIKKQNVDKLKDLKNKPTDTIIFLNESTKSKARVIKITTITRPIISVCDFLFILDINVYIHYSKKFHICNRIM